MNKKHELADLQRLYTEAESVDHDLFAEQRSNVLLIVGDHYARRGSRFWNRIRDTKELSNEQKLRLTKNHIQKIYKIYVNNILMYAPGVKVVPKNEKELSDQKIAELHQSVWEDLKARKDLKDKIRQWAEDFVGIGECFVKVFFDDSAGKLKGMLQATDELGQPLFDEMGQPVPSEEAVFVGDIVYERIFGANLLRDPGAKSMAEAQWVIHRKMVPVAKLKAMFPGDEEKQRKILESSDDTFKVFDGGKGAYTESKDQTLLMEHYFRPCPQYPRGYYYISTKEVILFEGELPAGEFPIVGVGWDEVPTSPRGRSIIKQLRPYQAEVNRCASKIAETQVTLGDDKLLIQSGTKLAPGGTLPGIRGIQFTGMTPTVMAGRSGNQYLEFMNSQIKEMYEAANLDYEVQEKQAQVDVYTQLYQQIRHKKRFMIYGQKFENFLTQVCLLSLKLAKHHYTEDHMVFIVGKAEQVNIPEFKKTEDLGFQIKLEPMTDDVESMMGKQLTLNHILQYVGPQLKPDDIGKIMRAMPFANAEEAFSDLTIDYDNSVSDILAMDRGEYRPAMPTDNHKYIMQRLVHRMKQRDFDYLPPQIKEAYQAKYQEHEQFEAQQLEQIRLAQAGFIPTEGYLVTVDFYVSDPSNPEKTKRARIPYESVKWLLERLDEQGKTQEELNTMEQGSLASLSNRLSSMSQQPAM